MHHASRFALAAACAFTWLPGMAPAAEPASAALQPADARAAVPATTYRPAIAWRPEAVTEASPDRTWAESNATVAGYDAMSLTMKRRAPAPADPHAGHAGHDMHAGHGAAPAGPAPHRKESP
jgi:hypothetical protein